MTSHQRALNREETTVACPHGPPATSRNALLGSLFLDKLTRGLAVYLPRFWGLPGAVTAGQAQSLGPQELEFPPAMRQTQKLAVTTSRLDYPVEVVHLSKRALKILQNHANSQQSNQPYIIFQATFHPSSYFLRPVMWRSELTSVILVSQSETFR